MCLRKWTATKESISMSSQPYNEDHNNMAPFSRVTLLEHHNKEDPLQQAHPRHSLKPYENHDFFFPQFCTEGMNSIYEPEFQMPNSSSSWKRRSQEDAVVSIEGDCSAK